jgi:hypothetical protein
MVKLVHMGGIFQSSEIQLVERNQQIVHIWYWGTRTY